MSDCFVDSSVAVKWLLVESDSAMAWRVVADVVGRGGKLLLLDLARLESANAIWRRHHRGLISEQEAINTFLLLNAIPIQYIEAVPLDLVALQLALKYDIAVYDAAFVAAVQQLNCEGVTADVPLHKAVGKDFPSIKLLKDW